jgi:hypothetical protein
MEWTWSSEHLHFDTRAKVVRSFAEPLLREFFGDRCEDFEPGCECCKRWAALDRLLENPFEPGE